MFEEYLSYPLFLSAIISITSGNDSVQNREIHCRSQIAKIGKNNDFLFFQIYRIYHITLLIIIKRKNNSALFNCQGITEIKIHNWTGIVSIHEKNYKNKYRKYTVNTWLVLVNTCTTPCSNITRTCIRSIRLFVLRVPGLTKDSTNVFPKPHDNTIYGLTLVVQIKSKRFLTCKKFKWVQIKSIKHAQLLCNSIYR